MSIYRKQRIRRTRCGGTRICTMDRNLSEVYGILRLCYDRRKSMWSDIMNLPNYYRLFMSLVYSSTFGSCFYCHLFHYSPNFKLVFFRS